MTMTRAGLITLPFSRYPFWTTSDIESLILDSSSSSEITKANDEEVETGSLEEFIEDQF